MKLLDIIVKDAIEPNLEATSRDEAIGLLIDKLIKANVLNEGQRDDFIKAIIKRERRGIDRIRTWRRPYPMSSIPTSTR